MLTPDHPPPNTAAPSASTTALAATALTGLGFLSPASGATVRRRARHHHRARRRARVHREPHGLDAYVSLYENDLHGNVVQVILDDDPARAAQSRASDILRAGEVRTGVRIGEHRARIRGTAHRVPVAQRTPVHEDMDDAGQHIVVDGFHRRLVNDLVLRYDGTRVPLTCAPAFAYRLTVTKTDLTRRAECPKCPVGGRECPQVPGRRVDSAHKCPVSASESAHKCPVSDPDVPQGRGRPGRTACG